jgi:hypothetical protein
MKDEAGIWTTSVDADADILQDPVRGVARIGEGSEKRAANMTTDGLTATKKRWSRGEKNW